MDDQTKQRGRASRGAMTPVYARVPNEKHDLLQRIKEEKGWSLVTALERAIEALAKQEGIS